MPAISTPPLFLALNRTCARLLSLAGWFGVQRERAHGSVERIHVQRLHGRHFGHGHLSPAHCTALATTPTHLHRELSAGMTCICCGARWPPPPRHAISHHTAQALTALPATLDPPAPYLAFVENFGTHLPEQVVFGGSVTTSSFLARMNLTVST